MMQRRAFLKFNTGLLAIVLFLALAGAMFFMRRPAKSPEYFDKSLTLASATEQAEKTGKPLLVLATADWCGPCQSLKRSALVDPAVAKLITSNTVPFYADVTSEKTAPAGVEQLRVSGIPAMILIKNGQEISRLVGNQPTEKVLAWLSQDAR